MIRSYTAAEVAHIWRRPVGTVHRLASERETMIKTPAPARTGPGRGRP